MLDAREGGVGAFVETCVEGLQFLDDRQSTAQAIGEEFTGFFTRGVERLKLVATLPALVYGLETLEDSREGRQIPTWTTLHYLFYESDRGE